MADWKARLHVEDPPTWRSEGQRDRDRILYTAAFRRLAGVTQVTAEEEGRFFHNRLTHSLKVSQVARRLAERLILERGKDFANEHGFDEDIVEAAALGHDLGHPPFGHTAEVVLNELANQAECGGFEGNAQSFRVVTKLAPRDYAYEGLNLTRGTLNGLLKYPWMRIRGGEAAQDKWGAYESEREEFGFAREDYEDGELALAAQIMDWSDDVTYAVHDLEDFFRARLIPVHDLGRSDDELSRFRNSLNETRKVIPRLKSFRSEDIEGGLENLSQLLALAARGPYRGTDAERANMNLWSSQRIGEYVSAFQVNDEGEVKIDREKRCEVNLLKELTWFYVIESPALATTREGQRRVVRNLYRTFNRAAERRSEWSLLPMAVREKLELGPGDSQEPEAKKERARIVIDLIAGMAEERAYILHHRICGVAAGSVVEQVQ